MKLLSVLLSLLVACVASAALLPAAPTPTAVLAPEITEITVNDVLRLVRYESELEALIEAQRKHINELQAAGNCS